PAYWPQAGHATCCGFSSLHARFEHGTRCTALVFHCERRMRVWARDFLFFGTATAGTPLNSSRPAGAGLLTAGPGHVSRSRAKPVRVCRRGGPSTPRRTSAPKDRPTDRPARPTGGRFSHVRVRGRVRPTSRHTRHTTRDSPA